MAIVNMASGLVSIFFGLRGPNICIATACATGTHAIGESCRIIKSGDADIMVAGGAEASITRLGIGGFCALNALAKWDGDPQEASRPFDAKRCGFVMGKGLAFLFLKVWKARRSAAQKFTVKSAVTELQEMLII